MNQFPRQVEITEVSAELQGVAAELIKQGYEVRAGIGETGYQWLLVRGCGRSASSANRLARRLEDLGLNSAVPHPDARDQGFALVYNR